MDRGDGCTTLQLYWLPLKFMLKNG
jgi:hypothetical protein